MVLKKYINPIYKKDELLKKLITQFWAIGCRQIHKIKENRFLYEMFYS